MTRNEPTLFSALLRHWRTRRGLSQLELALAAEISARHLSFLETSRARPSRRMTLLLGSVLGLGLRDQNALLRAADLEPAFAEPGATEGLPREVDDVLARLLAHHEPYPMVVMTRGYDLLRANDAASRVLVRFVHDPAALGATPNLLRALFDPRGVRPYVEDWEQTARTLLSRLHREALAAGPDSVVAALVRELVTYPDVPASFRFPDFDAPTPPTFRLVFRRDGLRLAFVAMLTAFEAPQNVLVEELRIESYFPLDDATAAICEEHLPAESAYRRPRTPPTGAR